MIISLYDNPANKKILPIYSILFLWDIEVTGTETESIEFRLLGEESQLVIDAITRTENGGNRLVGYKVLANIFITDSTVTVQHIEKILQEKPTRCYVDLRPYKTTEPGYSHKVLSLSNYDGNAENRYELTNFSIASFKRETTKDIYKMNIQVACLYGKDKLSNF